MNKKLPVLTIFFLLVLGNVNHGKTPSITQQVRHLSPTTNKKELKLGLQLGGMPFIILQAGVVGEYRWSERVGVRSGILFHLVSKVIKEANELIGIPNLEYVLFPIMITNYLIPDHLGLNPGGQCYLLYGVELGYLMKKNSIPSGVDKDKLRKVQVGITAGLNYEFSWGFVMGISFTKYLIDIVPKGQPYDNWGLHGLGGWGMYPTMGINFVKLFNKVYHLFK